MMGSIKRIKKNDNKGKFRIASNVLKEKNYFKIFMGLIKKSNDTSINSCINLFCTNWRDINSLVEWKYKIIKINHVG